MGKNLCTLEDLPNEIFIEIFKNLDARYLFHAFYNLNIRLNILLQSLDHCLTVSTPDFNRSVDDEIFFPYVHTLIIKNGVDITFDHLINVHRLILHDTVKYSTRDVQVHIALNLEQFSVLSTHFSLFTFSTDFIQKTFSNDFPYLKSCCLSEKAVISSSEKWTESPSLRIFQTGPIRSNIYQSILSSCPNLYSLQFTKWPKDPYRFHIEPHINLKRMVIKFCFNDFLHHHLSSVPKLEQLVFRLLIRETQSLQALEDCDWFASIIESNLPMLRQFHCYVIFTAAANINEKDQENIRNKMKEKFEQIHKDRYQSKIEFKFPRG
jgi:hypothetical protein